MNRAFKHGVLQIVAAGAALLSLASCTTGAQERKASQAISGNQQAKYEAADLQHGFAVQDQRRADEERGDGLLGYEYMRDYVDLNLWFIADDPEAKPDAGGRRWSAYGDWLIANDRLPLLLACSPWGKEYVDNVFDHFSIGMRKVWGDKLADLTAYRADGTPAPGVRLFHTDLTEEEALRKARRGPAGALDSDTP